MSRHRYGQGNGPGWAKRQRANRRNAEIVRTTDEPDLGNRPGLASLLGLADASLEGPPEHIEAACVTLGCPTCLAESAA